MSTNNSPWNRLCTLAKNTKPVQELFTAEANRAQNMSFEVGNIFADFSKQRICQKTLSQLHELAKVKNIAQKRAELFNGDPINKSENRCVLHPALRGVGGDKNIKSLISKMNIRTKNFAQQIHKQGKFTTIIHIGIGGSDLGPRLCAEAFVATQKQKLELRFIENIDGACFNDAVKDIDPTSTLIITVSKTFSTLETKMNSIAAKKWLATALNTEEISQHMVAVTANRKEAIKFGILEAQIFDFWDWVGGRYSLWSAVGLSLQIAFGTESFANLLAGAAHMDEHFKNTSIKKNLPIMLALTGIWNRNFLDYHSQAIICYARRLRKLPSFLQQLEMESNGKSTTQSGQPTELTCPIIWGDEGTNSQHAFFQYLHQGTYGAPIDFIAVQQDHENKQNHHRALLANCLAQSEALMIGKSEKQVRLELAQNGLEQDKIDMLAPQKTFTGNRPSTTLLLKDLSPFSLGNLIALYEHKVFVQSIVWGNNAFDQWGVELGKVLADTILQELANQELANQELKTNRLTSDNVSNHDASTTQLMARIINNN